MNVPLPKFPGWWWKAALGVAGVAGVALLARRIVGVTIDHLGQAYDANGNPTPWHAVPLGFSSSVTIGNDGCMLTSLTMAVNAFTGVGFDPSDANDIAKAANAFAGAMLDLVPAAAALGVVAPESERIRAGKGASVPQLKAALDHALERGGVALLNVDHHYTGSGVHFLLVHGKSGGGYVAADPALARDVVIDSQLHADVSWGGSPVVYDGVGVAPIYRS